jgi:hypothetical protein
VGKSHAQTVPNAGVGNTVPRSLELLLQNLPSPKTF